MDEIKAAIKAILDHQTRLLSASDIVLLLQDRGVALPEDKQQAWHLVAGLRYGLAREEVSNG